MPEKQFTNNLAIGNFQTTGWLEKLPCFQLLKPEATRHLLRQSSINNCKINEIVWSSGDPSNYFVTILNGTMTVSRSNDQGDENTLGVFGPGDVIGLSAVLRGSPFPATARSCSSATEILKISSSAIHLSTVAPDFNSEQSALDLWLQNLVLAHERILQDKIQIIGAGSVPDRTRELMRSLVRRFGNETDGHENFIPLALTKTLVAKLVGARVETVIRLLRSWEKAGALEMTRQGIYIRSLEDLI
jgi:CRP/FNR family transcriptional regulator